MTAWEKNSFRLVECPLCKVQVALHDLPFHHLAMHAPKEQK